MPSTDESEEISSSSDSDDYPKNPEKQREQSPPPDVYDYNDDRGGGGSSSVSFLEEIAEIIEGCDYQWNDSENYDIVADPPMDPTLFELDFSLQDQYLANFIDLAQNTSSIEQHRRAQAGNVGGAYLGPGTTFGVEHTLLQDISNHRLVHASGSDFSEIEYNDPGQASTATIPTSTQGPNIAQMPTPSSSPRLGSSSVVDRVVGPSCAPEPYHPGVFSGLPLPDRNIGSTSWSGPALASSSSSSSELAATEIGGQSTSAAAINAATYHPRVSVERALPSYPQRRRWTDVLIWNICMLSAGVRIALPLWFPIGFLPDPPTFPTWLSHPKLHTLSEHFISTLLSIYPSEIWARIINYADELCAYHEFMAQWFSRHDLRLHYVSMNLFLACIILYRSSSNADFQPGTTFLDPSTRMRYYFGFIERPAIAILRFLLKRADRRRGELTRLLRDRMKKAEKNKWYGPTPALTAACTTIDGWLRYQPIIDTGPGGVVLRFSSAIFVDNLLQLAFAEPHHFRQHPFGLRGGALGDPGTSGLIPDTVIGNAAFLGYIISVGELQPHGVRPEPLTAFGRYRGPAAGATLSHDELCTYFIQLATAERAAHPLEFRFLEFCIFELAERRGMIAHMPTALPPFDPDAEDVDWEELVPGDGRVWIAYL